MHRATSVILSGFLLLPATRAAAQEKPEEARSTGLPSAVKWTFNFDAGWGTFGFANSLYTNPKDPGVPQDLSDQWFEGYAKPALSGRYTLASTSELYGKASVVGERTYGAAPPVAGVDVGSFGPEDAYIGWRSGQALDLGENALDFSVGRIPYTIGHGLLLYDGASEGGSRGGVWTNARKAFQFGALGKLKVDRHTAELFYLDRDELRERDSGTRLWGANYEFGLDDDNTFGASYLRLYAKPGVRPERDGLHVFNVRAYTAPIASAPDLSFEFEYASERNGDALHANAFTVTEAYEFSDTAWQPKISYRYAYFQGDDPATARNESFDPLMPGFYDWGTWWQGEIAGEYFLSNSNLVSHQIRAHLTPRERLSGGLIFYLFRLDHPESYGPGVTSKAAATETDAYVDWKANAAFTISFVGAFANPQKAVQQATGRTKNFAYGMVYVAYSF